MEFSMESASLGVSERRNDFSPGRRGYPDDYGCK
jgi:hypothetical protein